MLNYCLTISHEINCTLSLAIEMTVLRQSAKLEATYTLFFEDNDHSHVYETIHPIPVMYYLSYNLHAPYPSLKVSPITRYPTRIHNSEPKVRLYSSTTSVNRQKILKEMAMLQDRLKKKN